MNRIGFLMAVMACGFARAQAPSGVPATIVARADTFLGTLDEGQRSRVLFDFNDTAQRVRWSNLPTTMVARAGLKMGELKEPQKAAAMALLAATLSRRGYQKVLAIMEGDEILKTESGGRGGMFGKDLFYISILGKPSVKDPWMLQFGGHHLALNITMVGRDGILTPSLTAAQPAKYTVAGKTVRPLGAENDKAFALINALDEGQRKQAILNYKVADLVLGPGQDGKTIQPEGLKASAMNAGQQAMLLDLVSEWAGIINEPAATARMADVKTKMADTWFAWSGPTTNGTPAYYRIQGPTLVIEYAPQPLGGDPTMHIHTIYRDPANDYGKKIGKAMKRLLSSVLLAIGISGHASAHRLDEYLQATLIGITRDRVDLEINLTPGVAVLPVVMAAIDRNSDGRISPDEEQAYAGQVLRDVTLQVDGRPASLRLVDFQFPSAQAMSEGLGTIRLKLRADRAGRELRFENRHLRAVSVYLVNCLASEDGSLAVGKPERDATQRSIHFAYSFDDASGTRADPAWPVRGSFWLAAIGILAAARLAWQKFRWQSRG